MTFIPNKEIQGINSDQYEAPSENCSCSAATIAVAIDRATGAQLVTSSPASASGGTGGTTTTSTSFAGTAYGFVVVNDAVFSALTASGDTAPSELTAITLPAGLAIVTDVEAATLSSGVVTFYNK